MKRAFSVALWLSLTVSTWAAEPKAINLLQLPKATIETSAAPTIGDQFQLLRDDNVNSIGVFPASAAVPAEIVVGFAGETVAFERLIVTVGDKSPDVDPPSRVELMVSTVSPHAGFQSVRSDPLESGAKAQEFPFSPIGAKWVMLRFFPAEGAKRVGIAEVVVRGYEGAPQTRYQFKESPAKAFDVLRRLAGDRKFNVSISDDEAKMFDDAKDRRFDDWSFAEAALLASGIVDQSKRQSYLSKLDKLEAEAKRAIQEKNSAFDRAEALLKFLHAGPMSKGYESHQTDVASILDTGTFNCVSSATLYNVLGRRLGLDCRAIEVPEHAFAIVYDGAKHADVETTTPDGFNPSRDPAAQEKFTQLTGFLYIPDRNRDERREVGEVGLVAIAYYNHGVELSRKKQHYDALLAYFRAMSLDAEFDSAVKNALAALANWGVDLSREKKFDEALNVVSTGLELAPEDATLVNNHKAIWGNWSESLIKEGKSAEALSVLRKAASAIPEGNFVNMQAWVFIRPGEELIKSGRWEEALTLVEPGLQQLDGEPRFELEEWGENLFHRWAQSEQKAGHFDKAVDLLARALALHPDDEETARHLAYVAQESAKEAYARDGAERSQELVTGLVRRFPNVKDVRDVAEAHAQRVVVDLTKKGKFEDALAAASRSAKLLEDEQLATELVHSVFDQQARELSTQKQWQKAADIYVQALAKFPKDEHFQNNLSAVWDAWAQTHAKQRDYANALEVYEKALKNHPDPEHLEQNICFFVQEWAKDVQRKEGAGSATKVLKAQIARFKNIEDLSRISAAHFQRVVQDLADKEKYDEAIKVVETSGDMLDDEDRAGLAALIYDKRAAVHTKKKDRQGAVDAYAEGLKKFPDNRHIANNAVVAWQQWAKTFIDKKDWPGAIVIYEKALQQFPDDGTLRNNLEYCQQQAKKQK